MLGLVIFLQHQQNQNPVEKQQQDLHHLSNTSKLNHKSPLVPPLSRDFFGKASSEKSGRGNSSTSRVGSTIPINMRRVTMDTVMSKDIYPPTTIRSLLLLVGWDVRGSATQVTHATKRFVSDVAEVLVGPESQRRVQHITRTVSYAILVVPVRLAMNVTTSLAVTGFQALRPWLPDTNKNTMNGMADGGNRVTTTTTSNSTTITYSFIQQQLSSWTPKIYQTNAAPTTLVDQPSTKTHLFETIAARAAMLLSSSPENDTTHNRPPYPSRDRFLSWVQRIQGASLMEHYSDTSTKNKGRK